MILKEMKTKVLALNEELNADSPLLTVEMEVNKGDRLEFAEYNAYAEACKEAVKAEIEAEGT